MCMQKCQIVSSYHQNIAKIIARRMPDAAPWEAQNPLRGTGEEMVVSCGLTIKKRGRSNG